MLIFSSLLIILGGIAFFSSVLFRTPEAPPFASLNPKLWKPVWHHTVQDSFRPPGYVLMNGGLVLFLIGTLLHWVFVDWPW